MTEDALAASTSGQVFDLQVMLPPGELELLLQYAAEAYCSMRLKVLSNCVSTAPTQRVSTPDHSGSVHANTSLLPYQWHS